MKSGPYVLLSVADTDQGMDEETQAKIFDLIFTTREVGQGTGLGLCAVHGIVKKHQGQLSVESEPGKGAVFTIYWPCCDRVSQKPHLGGHAVD